VAIGIDGDGKRSVLGTSVSLSEAEVHWRTFLASLQDRGLHGVELIISDDHAGLGAARKARFAGVAWQRCQFHLQQNAQSYVPRRALKRVVAEGLRGVFNAIDRADADRKLAGFVATWREDAPKLASWAEENIDEGLTVFDLGLTEAGLDGVLGTGDDRAVGSTTTAGDGSYGFAGLPPGLYRLDVDEGTLPPGHVLSSGNEPLDRTLAAAQVVTNAASEARTNCTPMNKHAMDAAE